MSILILGGAGNLGTQLKKSFVSDNIVAWDRDDFDFLDFAQLQRRLFELKPDVIINTAAYNAVDKCETDETETALAWKLNRDLPGVLADYCLEHDILLVHYSTDYVFGGDGRLSSDYDELARPVPMSVYGQTKFGGEQEIARRALSGLNYYLIRTSKLFGPKAENEGAKPSFFDIVLELGKKNPEVKAIDSEISCFTYTPDLAVATKAMISEKCARGIYHLTNSGPVTWYDGVKELFALAEIKTPLIAITPEEWPRPAKRPVFSALANTRRPRLRPWQAALAEYIKTK
ncbi:MAG: NAD(P)-dependent oxidoreductase [bacterium]|nr:NAD(P)-dependent oxidoreductase [bacterium]